MTTYGIIYTQVYIQRENISINILPILNVYKKNSSLSIYIYDLRNDYAEPYGLLSEIMKK